MERYNWRPFWWTSTPGDYSSAAELLGFLEDRHSAERNFILTGGFKMKNTTKYQCEMSCTSPITCYPVYMPHLPKMYKTFLPIIGVIP
jgi:hypothetical protein